MSIEQHKSSQRDHISQSLGRSDLESAWKMNFTILSFVLLFCSLTLAQEDGNANDIETKGKSPSRVADQDLLREFGAMTDKLGAMETRMKDSEKQIVELRNRGRVKFKDFIEESIKNIGYCNNND